MLSNTSLLQLNADPELKARLDAAGKKLLHLWESERVSELRNVENQPLTEAEIKLIHEARRRVAAVDNYGLGFMVVIAKLAYKGEKLAVAELGRAIADNDSYANGIHIKAVWHDKRFVPTSINITGKESIEIPYALVDALGLPYIYVNKEQQTIGVLCPQTSAYYTLEIVAQSRNIDGAYLCRVVSEERQQ